MKVKCIGNWFGITNGKIYEVIKEDMMNCYLIMVMKHGLLNLDSKPYLK